MVPPLSTATDCSGQEDKSLDYNKIIPGAWDDDKFEKACQIWSLTPEETAQLKDLQSRLSDLQYYKNEPHHVLWFMRGPLGFSTSSIEHHFRKMVQWRLENDIDGLLDRYQPPLLQVQNTVCSVLKDEDRDGDPIYVERGGAINPVRVLKQSSREEMLEYAIWVRELHMRGPWIREYERRHGHPVKGITIIYDLKGLSPGHMDPRVLGVFKDVIKLTKEYYSAPVKRMIIIRAPALFRMAWAIVKHIFPASARKKMIFCGTDNYLDVLHSYVDLDVLPTCINPLGHGCTQPGMPKMIGEEAEHVGVEKDPCATTLACSNPEASEGTAESIISELSSESLESGSAAVRVEVTCKKLLSGGYVIRPKAQEADPCPGGHLQPQ